MSFTLGLSNRTKSNIRTAYRWYEKQRNGLGDEFIDYVYDAFKLIKTSPYLFAPYNVHYRRMVLPRFPYAIIYEVSEEERVITILRVVHQKRGTD